MGTLLAENPCAHRKSAIEELIKGRARDAAAQPQILFGKPTGDHDWHEELLVKLLTSFTESLSHILTSSCEHCEVSQIRNQVRSPIGNQRSVDPGESSKRPAAQDRRDFYKRRRTDENDQGCQETEQVQRIQEAPDMNPTNYFGHHTSISYSLNSPFQNPSLEAPLRSFSSMTISTQDSEPYLRSFASMIISTQDSESYSRSFSPSSASSVRKECREETVQSNSLPGDLLFLPSQLLQPMIPFFQQGGPHEHQFFGAVKATPSSDGAFRRWRKLASVLRFCLHLRCTHQKLYNCPAKKQVQRRDNKPFIFEVT